MALKITALAGGVGGAKLVDGLDQAQAADALRVIVNTGDDFNHLGLHISPDLDTVVYTLAGIANPATGWGRRDETWQALGVLEELGGPSWFRLGDRDLGMHLARTHALGDGRTLSEFTQAVCRRLAIKAQVLPMSDDPVRTVVHTVDEGDLPFQVYFVARDCEPKVKGFSFSGAAAAAPAPGVLEGLQQADAIVLCPSNPWVSLDPILAVPGVRAALAGRLVLAVSPIISGRALKGPAAKIYREMGVEPSAAAVARHYQDLLDGFVLDDVDRELESEIKAMGMKTLVTDTVMNDRGERLRLAQQVLQFAGRLAGAGVRP